MDRSKQVGAACTAMGTTVLLERSFDGLGEVILNPLDPQEVAYTGDVPNSVAIALSYTGSFIMYKYGHTPWGHALGSAFISAANGVLVTSDTVDGNLMLQAGLFFLSVTWAISAFRSELFDLANKFNSETCRKCGRTLPSPGRVTTANLVIARPTTALGAASAAGASVPVIGPYIEPLVTTVATVTPTTGDPNLLPFVLTMAFYSASDISIGKLWRAPLKALKKMWNITANVEEREFPDSQPYDSDRPSQWEGTLYEV